MSDRVYCYPNSNVLKNRLNIQNLDVLCNTERKLTALRLIELLTKPVPGNFDLKHLQAIHYHIFQDIYEWAGKLRTVNIEKGNMFCNVLFIESQAEEIFSKLKRDYYLNSMPYDDFVKKLAYYFSELNALHPFREGNGRSRREFIRLLALKNGYVISFRNISEEEMLMASEQSFLCNYEPMEHLFQKCISAKRS